MTTTDAITLLRTYNQWRRGAENIEQPNPTEIGIALDIVLNALENSAQDHAQADTDTLRALEERNAARMERDAAIEELEAWRSENGPDGWWVKHEEYTEQKEQWMNANAILREQLAAEQALADRLARILKAIAGRDRRGNRPKHRLLADQGFNIWKQARP